ncbi:hypothetical protein pb186bvf_014973 [Paramecium bursaria]
MQNPCQQCKKNSFDCECSDEEYEVKPKQVHSLKDIYQKHSLSEIRIISKNLIYVIGLAPNIANELLLRKQEYFGQYGTIQKLIVIQSNTFNPPSHAAYITYKNEIEASVAILVTHIQYIVACESFHLQERTVKASFGTTKFCTNFLKGAQCKIKECVYLHNHPRDKESTEVLKKDEMNNSKWLFDYSLKLAKQNFCKYYSTLQMKNVSNSIFPTISELFNKMYEQGLIEKQIKQQDYTNIQQQIDHKGLEKRLEDIILNMKADNDNSRFKFISKTNSDNNYDAINLLKQQKTKTTKKNSQTKKIYFLFKIQKIINKFYIMIILKNQNKEVKKKLTEMLIDNNITFSPIKGKEYEAVVRIKAQQQDPLSNQIGLRIKDIELKLKELNGQRSVSSQIKIKSKERLESQLQQWNKIQEIYDRSNKFSDSLKSLFYITLYYYWLENPFHHDTLKLEDIVYMFHLVFFQKPNNLHQNPKQQEILNFCRNHLKSQQFQDYIQFKRKPSPQKYTPPKSASPVTRTPTKQQQKQATMENLSTTQILNYYNRILKSTKKASPPKTASPMKRLSQPVNITPKRMRF